MDNVLSSLVRAISRILGKTTCGFDCSFSDFGVTEYIILFFTLVFAFLLGKKLLKLLKNR